MSDTLYLARRLAGLQEEYRDTFSASLEARRESDRLIVLLGDLENQIRRTMEEMTKEKT